MNLKLAGVFILILLLSDLSAQVPYSVLKTGQWYKFSVSTDGIYKIDYNLLKKAGLNPDQIDPKKIKIYSGLNSMLPQANSAPNDYLKELAIAVTGEQDGKFNKEDAILFYGQGSDAIAFNTAKNLFSYQNNLYSDKNYYFLTVADEEGKRITTNPSIAGSFPIINQFDDFSYYETDKYNILSSGREWFGEQFDSSPEIRIRFDTPGIVPNSDIQVVSHVMSHAYEQSSFKVFFNNIEIGQQSISPIPNTTYGIKGRKAMDTLSFNSTTVNAATQSSFEIKYQYIKTGTMSSVGYLDFITISTKRSLNWNGNQFSFVSAISLQNPTSTFNVNALPEGGHIWEVTDPFNTSENTLITSSDKVSFSTATTFLKKFAAFTDQTLLAPAFESAVPNQNTFDGLSSELIIVTHPDFKTEALRLAAHRTQHDGLSVYVVTTEEIYNEYSGGKQDITAIRNYVRLIYSHSGSLKNLLLFGRCSYDYKNRVISNTNFVPTYQSRNSLSPLETYSSDDYFGFFEATEGEWSESPAVNHTMEIGVGRLSVKKAEEAKDVVDKLIAYDLSKNAYGKWRKEILFVADDGDFNIHQSQAEQMANDIELTNPQFNTSKLYLDSYKQLTRPSGQYSPDATDALNRAVNKGNLIVNFTGHGSEHVWLQERILDPTSINVWKNKNQLPLFVTATCEFGRHDDPDPTNISTAELILIKKNGGAIGIVTTARPVNSSTNFVLNKAFYNALFEKKDGHYKDLGNVFRDTKNQSLSGVSNRNFSLLGDPSMHLAIPEKEIVITEIKTANDSDTLKALSNMIIKGEIQSAGSLSADFTGVIQTTLYNQPSSVMTLGDENPVFTFKAWDHILFQGKTSVVNGTFEINGIIPKAAATDVGNGKLSVYAYNDTFSDQAFGANTDLKVGDIELISDGDSKGPDIELFMGDTTYRQGGAVGASTQLVATLFDKHGIDVSGYDGGNIEILLDDSIHYIANTYYETALDDYKNGILSFPITGLQKGTHNIKLTARDTYSNASSANITFDVSEGNTLVIDDLMNYPNPFAGKTTIQFSHNRPGEDLEAQMVIYNSVGQPVNSASYSIPESLYKVTLTEWDGTANGINLTNGIYFMKLSVRSLSDGAKNERLTKLIVLN